MILGMSLATFVLCHVVISLIAIVAGWIVMFASRLAARCRDRPAIFLLFDQILTSATGFLRDPAADRARRRCRRSRSAGKGWCCSRIACIALYAMQLRGVWRPIYVVTAMVFLYLNVFVLVIQELPQNSPPLQALAPAVPPNPPSGPVLAAVQGIVLVFFAIGDDRRLAPVQAGRSPDRGR